MRTYCLNQDSMHGIVGFVDEMKSEKEKYLKRIRNLDRRRGYIPDESHYPRLSRVSEEKYYLLVPKVLERDNNTCQWCGRTGVYTDVHHIDGNKDNNKMENLITVCRSCHKRHHSKRETKERIETDRWRRNYYRLKGTRA